MGNRYKIQLNVKNNGRDECLSRIRKEFKTARNDPTKMYQQTLQFIVPEQAKTDRFSIKDHGQTLVLKGYDSGCCLLGNYLDCTNGQSAHTITMKMSNISPSGFGIGFATKA